MTSGINIKNQISKNAAARQLNQRATTGARDVHLPRSVSLATSLWRRLDTEAFTRRASVSSLVAKAVTRCLPRSRQVTEKEGV